MERAFSFWRKPYRLAAAAVVGSSLLATSPAWAMITCNSDGDCWHTEERVSFPGVTLSFHDDKWRDEHRDDRTYVWHETDPDHDWHHGYWERKEWHRVD